MSDASQNLIEIQSALQDPVRVPMQDLMKYANGSNPQVPSFLALIELNRRKQIEQTAQNFEQPQGTVKDQTINALMGRQQVNPTAAPQGINPTAAPAQFTSQGTQRPQVMAPQQVNPTAPPMQAAKGGLMQIPVNNMFKSKNYAGGGIVALAGGGDYVEDSPGHYVLRSEQEDFPERARYKLGDKEILGPRSHEEILAGLPGITPLQGKRPGDMTPEQAFARQKEIQKLAGVAEDPYAEVKKYQADIEARQAEERKGNALDRLLAQAEAFATADPTKGFGYQAGISSKASRTLEAEQRAIRDKQEALNMDFRRNMAKEADARARDDATGIAAALKQQKDDQAAYDKLQMDWDRLEQGRHTTAANIRQSEAAEAKLPVDIYQAESQRRQGESTADYHRRMAAVAERGADLAELTKPTADDVIFNRLMARANQDAEIKALSSQLKDMDPSSPEYLQIQSAIYNKLKIYFAKNPDLLPPPPQQASPLAKKEKPGFWASLFGGSQSAPSNAVPFDQLPK